MDNQEQITRAVKKKIRQGYPAGEIRNDLLEKGYSEAEIGEFFSGLFHSKQKPRDKETGFNNSNSMLTLGGVSLLILGIAILSVNFW